MYVYKGGDDVQCMSKVTGNVNIATVGVGGYNSTTTIKLFFLVLVSVPGRKTPLEPELLSVFAGVKQSPMPILKSVLSDILFFSKFCCVFSPQTRLIYIFRIRGKCIFRNDHLYNYGLFIILKLPHEGIA